MQENAHPSQGQPYSRFTPSPRGGRRNWEQELRLPTRLELYSHGLVERRIATYGFSVWDVGENRLLMEHGALIVKGAKALPAVAEYGALSAVMHTEQYPIRCKYLLAALQASVAE